MSEVSIIHRLLPGSSPESFVVDIKVVVPEGVQVEGVQCGLTSEAGRLPAPAESRRLRSFDRPPAGHSRLVEVDAPLARPSASDLRGVLDCEKVRADWGAIADRVWDSPGRWFLVALNAPSSSASMLGSRHGLEVRSRSARPSPNRSVSLEVYARAPLAKLSPRPHEKVEA